MWRYLVLVHLLENAHREDLVRSRRRRRKLREHGSDDMTEQEFIQSYRLSHELFDRLMEELEPHIKDANRVGDLTRSDKLKAALTFYASGSYQGTVGQHSGAAMSQPSVSRAVLEVSEALNHPDMVYKYIRFPQNAEERTDVKGKFYQKYSIPGVIGCIDCTHIALQRPKQNEERYFNRKYFHSKNVQVVCDSDYNILSVDSTFGGATHDSFIFNQHPVKELLENLNQQEEHVYLLGDSGYALRSYMMTPIVDAAAGSPEEHYSKLQMSARSTVERTFGVLKGRWRCLLAARELDYDPMKVGKIVNACCVLHNMCNAHRVPFTPLTAQEMALEAVYNQREPAPQAPAQAGRRRVNRELERGQAERMQLVNMLWGQRRQL